MNKANECTCPSGDGSLVHPCPAHPAVEQAGANVGHGHVLPRADGVKMRCGGPGLCSECTADASRARAALAQPSPAPELERPEVAEVAFVLRNIGAMDAEDIDGDNVDLRFEDAEGRDTGCDVSIVEYAEKAADLFEQHDRIVGSLRAKADQLREALEWRKENQAGQRELLRSVTAERDAALARVAELESKLAELEKQESVALANRGNQCFWVKWTEAAAGLYGPGIKLYAAPVAQAQQLNDLDKQCRDDVARALGLRPNQERGFAWSYLLASIKSCVKASGDSAQAQHSGPGKYDEVLLPFLKSMEHELHANAGKGDRPGWLQMDRKTALLEIYYHLGKLQKATKGNDTAGIVEYAADVANMSMMLVDVCGLLAAAPGKEGV
ncbi:hypothetical protein RI828_001259 [Pseudomonas aeruginosa]|nr:hypothetical protein [Pseudomonas aeruginosa]ELF6909139.1 hypothetical protein [Pseudomonas aeruginosa]